MKLKSFSMKGLFDGHSKKGPSRPVMMGVIKVDPVGPKQRGYAVGIKADAVIQVRQRPKCDANLLERGTYTSLPAS